MKIVEGCAERVQDRFLGGFHVAEKGSIAESWGREGEDG